jgi:hypothetical protein
MIKNLFFSACLLLSLMSFAQDGTSSTYSYYGIGEVRFKGTLDARSMGGLAIEPDSIHINLQNPAGYASLKLTTFTMGGSQLFTNVKADAGKESTQRTTLDYMAVGFPLGKFGFGFGLLPYSSVGYKIKSEGENKGDPNKLFDGSGGMNKVFAGIGYKITPNWSFGADIQYNFGKIKKTGLEFVFAVPNGTREINTSYLSGVSYNIGMMYQAKLSKKLTFYSSVNFSPENDLNYKNTRQIASVFYTGSNFAVVDALEDHVTNQDLLLPSKLSFGAGIGETKKWLIGAQITTQNIGQLMSSTIDLGKISYEKSIKYTLGGYYVPNYSSYSSYAKRITYRGGLKYEKTGLIVNAEPINDFGFTLGLGLPIIGSFSNFNLGFEMGRKGTTKAGLVQENYANLSLSFSLNDKWFEKRRFN